MRMHPHSLARRSAQAGLTLVELMVSVTIGMLMLAALATLIGNQSSTRAELDKSGRMIESGRYAVNTMALDVQMAGFWGERSTFIDYTSAALPDPCATLAASIDAAAAVHVQGYSSPATGAVPSCVSDFKAGTDILVLRRADGDPIGVDAADSNEGQYYIQSGVDGSGAFSSRLAAAGGTDAINVDAAHFPLKKRDKVTPAFLRRVMVNIYYVSTCSVAGGSGNCSDGDGIPTLKRVELTRVGTAMAFRTVTIAEGIENLQIDYGRDSTGPGATTDGAPDGLDVDGTGLNGVTWQDVMTVKIHVLARSQERSAGYTDDKTYSLGTAGNITPADADKGYIRHVFVQTVRLVNPAGRRRA